MRRHLTLYSCVPQCIAVSIGHREGMRCESEPKIWPIRLYQRNSIPGQPSVCTLVSFPSTCVKRTSRVDAARHLQAKPPVFCFDLSVFVCLARNSLSSHRYDKAALLQKTKEKWNQPKKKKTKVYNVKVKNNIKRLHPSGVIWPTIQKSSTFRHTHHSLLWCICFQTLFLVHVHVLAQHKYEWKVF